MGQDRRTVWQAGLVLGGGECDGWFIEQQLGLVQVVVADHGTDANYVQGPRHAARIVDQRGLHLDPNVAGVAAHQSEILAHRLALAQQQPVSLLEVLRVGQMDELIQTLACEIALLMAQ